MLCAGAGAVFILEFGNENAKAARIPAVAQNTERGGTFRQLRIIGLLLAAAEHQRQKKRVDRRTLQLILHIRRRLLRHITQPLVHAAMDLKKLLRHLRRGDRLQEIADDVIVDRGLGIFKAVIAAEDDHLRRRAQLTHPRGKLQSRDHRHADVGQNEVGLQRFDLIECFDTVFRFADNSKSRRFPVHTFNDRAALLLLIVHDQHCILQEKTSRPQ